MSKPIAINDLVDTMGSRLEYGTPQYVEFLIANLINEVFDDIFFPYYHKVFIKLRDMKPYEINPSSH